MLLQLSFQTHKIIGIAQCQKKLVFASFGADKAIVSPEKPNKPCNLQHNILSFQACYKPLLKQVVEEIFNPERSDPVDIEHMSSGLTDLLKTGFSMFMKVK